MPPRVYMQRVRRNWGIYCEVKTLKCTSAKASICLHCEDLKQKTCIFGLGWQTTRAKTNHMPWLLIEPRIYSLFRVQNANPFFPFSSSLCSPFLFATPFLSFLSLPHAPPPSPQPFLRRTWACRLRESRSNHCDQRQSRFRCPICGGQSASCCSMVLSQTRFWHIRGGSRLNADDSDPRWCVLQWWKRDGSGTPMAFESPYRFENGGASSNVGVDGEEVAGAVSVLVCGWMMTKCGERDSMREWSSRFCNGGCWFEQVPVFCSELYGFGSSVTRGRKTLYDFG